jgi:CTP:molybdopterin cytidylyltransferase MocA
LPQAGQASDRIDPAQVFPHAAFAQLLVLRGDKGARSLLTQSTCPLIDLPFPGREVDLPADITLLESL